MATTVKVSEATRDRIRSFGGATLEDTIVEALDALDRTRFWNQAAAAAAAQSGLDEDERQASRERERTLDRALDGL